MRRVEWPLAADENVGRPKETLAFGHGNGFFEADNSDVAHYRLKDQIVAISEVEDFNTVDEKGQ